MPKEFNAHPSPEMEEYINRDGHRKKQAVETQARCACAAAGKVFVHRGRIKQTS